MSVIPIARLVDGEMYIWLFTPDTVPELVASIARTALNPEFGFSQEDADGMCVELGTKMSLVQEEVQ